ncbi:MAG: hypothetical protein JWN04_4305 [Myxococcaceae bacterium]|nr:hypothetical protein [Myxococcaceae bacterium]
MSRGLDCVADHKERGRGICESLQLVFARMQKRRKSAPKSLPQILEQHTALCDLDALDKLTMESGRAGSGDQDLEESSHRDRQLARTKS